MKYPKFLNEKYNTIGVCAMSSGVGHKLDSFDASIEYIQSNGFHIVETASVRNNSEPSIDAKTRVDELNSLVNDSVLELYGWLRVAIFSLRRCHILILIGLKRILSGIWVRVILQIYCFP